MRHSPALLKKKLLTKNNREMPVTVVPVQRAVNTKSKQYSSASIRSNIDLMDDSIIYNENDDNTSRTKSAISYYTEDDRESIENDIKSLYSNDPEDEQQRLAELQTIEKKKTHNVDQELLDVYMKKYKLEHQEHTTNELNRSSQILFGQGYASKDQSTSDV